MSVRYIVGDVLDVLRSMPDASVDLVLSSPPREPFLALRSYLPADHPDKAKEIGSEPTPGEFIDTLLDVTEECRRVLTPHGSLCFELGDTYAGSGGAGGDYNANGLREGQAKFRQNNLYTSGYSGGVHGRNTKKPAADIPLNAGPGWPLDKSLCLIPELYRIALVYGFNPLTGRTTERWRARNVVRWCRPNPPVGALADKVRPATSDMVIACTSRKRYFDLDAVRVPFTGHAGVGTGKRKGQGGDKPEDNRPNDLPTRMNTHAGAPPLDHWWHDEDTFEQDAWHISTEPYKGSHYATWPTDLCVKPILAMCPIKVCTTCGMPSERLHTENPDYEGRAGGPTHNNGEQGASLKGFKHKAHAPPKWNATGWSDCGHGTWRQGVTLDPFAGSGTTLLVASGHGRSAIGIDLDERNAELARARVGMWLEVEHHVPSEVPA